MAIITQNQLGITRKSYAYIGAAVNYSVPSSYQTMQSSVVSAIQDFTHSSGVLTYTGNAPKTFLIEGYTDGGNSTTSNGGTRFFYNNSVEFGATKLARSSFTIFRAGICPKATITLNKNDTIRFQARMVAGSWQMRLWYLTLTQIGYN
jgi:hypothetical protein